MITLDWYKKSMSLLKKINEQFNMAQKNRSKNLISTLRLVLAAIKDREISKRVESKGKKLDDSEIIEVLRKMKKQRQESVKLYQKGGRLELWEAENSEIKIIDTFLPKQIGEEETKKICEQIIKSLNISSIKDMGKIMGTLKSKYSDVIDFSKASSIVKSLLK